MPGIPLPLVSHIGDFVKQMKHYLNDDYTSVSEPEREQHVATVRTGAAGCAALIAPMPLPFADVWAITTVQIIMIRAIGNIRGYKLSESLAKEAFGTIAGGIVGQQVCLQLFKWGMPGAGGLGGAAFVYAWTLAMATTADHYFRRGGNMTRQELDEERRRNMDAAKHEARSKPQTQSSGPQSAGGSQSGEQSIQGRLAELQAVRDAGAISDEEFRSTRERILSGL